ncbi:hypothetical protein BHE74_00018444 [Ensete ventricosum]|nr:hypothetical protein BHE74_00018444 [Ensete ventricosum]
MESKKNTITWSRGRAEKSERIQTEEERNGIKLKDLIFRIIKRRCVGSTMMCGFGFGNPRSRRDSWLTSTNAREGGTGTRQSSPFFRSSIHLILRHRSRLQTPRKFGDYVNARNWQLHPFSWNTPDMVNTDLAAKSLRPGTTRPLTWPNQHSWSTGCTKDTRCRTAGLAQVRSAIPTCRRTPHHQYGRRGERRGSMVSHECGKVVRYEQPTTSTIKAPAPPQDRGMGKNRLLD